MSRRSSVRRLPSPDHYRGWLGPDVQKKNESRPFEAALFRFGFLGAGCPSLNNGQGFLKLFPIALFAIIAWNDKR